MDELRRWIANICFVFGRIMAVIESKRIFAIRFATCRITRNLPASGPLLMICHNRMLLRSLIRLKRLICIRILPEVYQPLIIPTIFNPYHSTGYSAASPDHLWQGRGSGTLLSQYSSRSGYYTGHSTGRSTGYLPYSGWSPTDCKRK